MSKTTRELSNDETEREEFPSLVQLKGGSIEKTKGYSKYSYRGFVEAMKGSEKVEWYRTKIQEDDLVNIGFPATISNEFAQPFVSASAFWNQVIGETPIDPIVFDSDVTTGELVEACATDPAFTIAAGDPLNILILALVVPIDGPGNILGSAGPCGSANGFARIGIMRFDSADATNLINGGSFEEVVRHEMGHVLGIGTFWSDLVSNPCTSFNPCVGNPVYTGENGIQGFEELGGSGSLFVANTGGSGTANAHWRESTFQNELMTGFLSPGVNPFSLISARAMEDLGFVVDLDVAETYQIPGVEIPDETNSPTTSPTEEVIDLGDDVDPNDPEEISPINEFFLRNRGVIIVASIAIAGLLLALAVLVFLKRGRNQRNRAPNNNQVAAQVAFPAKF